MPTVNTSGDKDENWTTRSLSPFLRAVTPLRAMPLSEELSRATRVSTSHVKSRSGGDMKHSLGEYRPSPGKSPQNKRMGTLTSLGSKTSSLSKKPFPL